MRTAARAAHAAASRGERTTAKPRAEAATPGLPGPSLATATRPAACACGGGCPRCQAPRWQRDIAPALGTEEQRAERVASAALARRPVPADATVPRPEPSDLGRGEPLDAASRNDFEPRFGCDLSALRLHRGGSADRRARELGAAAFSQGVHIGFRSGHGSVARGAGRALLAHEIAHVLGPSARAAPRRLHRHPVAPTPLLRHDRVHLFGDGTPAHPGIDVDSFDSYTREQADWFAEPSLTVADRDMLWALMRRLLTGTQVAAGVGDVKLADLTALTPADWTALDDFGRTRDPAFRTVRVARATAYTVPQRIAMGQALVGLERLHNLTPEVLEITVAEQQLADVATAGTLPAITDYWTRFHPFLQQRFEPGPGARGPEFQKVLDLLAGPNGITDFLPLRVRIRNLHRFSRVMLTRLVANFADTTRSKPVQLVLHTGHDASAFQQSMPLFEALVLQAAPPGVAAGTYRSRLVLFLEGGETLADLTLQVNALRFSHGQLDDHGIPRLEQVMLAGHGSARSIGMAGAGPPRIHEGLVEYDDRGQGINLDAVPNADTLNLIDALLRALDPATARLVFAGCLVGANPVPEGTPTADIASYIATHPNLAGAVEARGRALGLPAGFVMAARASVGLSAASSLRTASGGLTIDYGYDRAAFGSALRYASTGKEAEGVLVAAVEVAGMRTPVEAAAALHARLALPPDPADWWDVITRVAVATAVDGLAAGAPLDVARTNTLAHLIQIPYLSRWANYGVGVAHFLGRVNIHPAIARSLYTRLMASVFLGAPPDLQARWMRFVVEQSWIALGDPRAADLITFLDAQPTLTPTLLAARLNRAALTPAVATLFPIAGPFTAGRLRLALAWSGQDAAQADVQNFLLTQVLRGAGAPTLTPALTAQLDGLHPNTLLTRLGVPLGAVIGGGGGAAPLPAANAEVTGDRRNDVLVEQRLYEAIVLPYALNVRRQPSMAGRVIGHVKRGDSVRVVGFTHDWAAIQFGARLGFVYRTQITAP